jgi:flagellum-specific ATP synthase
MQNHYPAIDVLASISRVMDDVVHPTQLESARAFKSLLATYKKAEDLINIGAYVSGSNPKIDLAIRMIDRINTYLNQEVVERVLFEESVQELEKLVTDANAVTLDKSMETVLTDSR